MSSTACCQRLLFAPVSVVRNLTKTQAASQLSTFSGLPVTFFSAGSSHFARQELSQARSNVTVLSSLAPAFHVTLVIRIVSWATSAKTVSGFAPETGAAGAIRTGRAPAVRTPRQVEQYQRLS